VTELVKEKEFVLQAGLQKIRVAENVSSSRVFNKTTVVPNALGIPNKVKK
jgi:hypothetical protein